MPSLLKFRPSSPVARPKEATSFGKRAVGTSPDLERILALPRRPKPDTKALAAAMTARLRKHNLKCKCAALRPNDGCILELNEIQGWYLSEAAEVGGVLGAIGVGHGKTGIGILLPMVVPGCKVAVLMMPPSLKKQFEYDFECWSQHFDVPNLAGGMGTYIPGRPVLHVLAYSELSHESCSTWLATIKPDLVIGDEVQNLKDVKSVRTDRWIRYMQKNPTTAFFCHSGSLSTRSIGDYAHLSAVALGNGSPLPIEKAVVTEWASALDPVSKDGMKAPAGALKALCEPAETVYEGFSRRLGDTSGVIRTAESTLGLPPLSIDERKVAAVPKAILDALQSTRDTECRPDGEELLEATQVAAVCRQLAAGFFYRWKFPRMEPEEQIVHWFNVRQTWNRELRERLKNRREGMDSPKLCRDAAERWHRGYTHEANGREYQIPPRSKSGPLPTWESDVLLEWEAVENNVYHETEAVWLSDFLVEDAIAWARENTGIVWYEHGAFGARVAKIGKIPFFGGGDEASGEIVKEAGKRSIVASIKAHGTGKNLQMFNRALFASPPADAGAWEQTIGRQHRQGQRAKDVRVHVYRHTPEMVAAFDKARERARYIQETLQTPMKILYAGLGFKVTRSRG